MSSPLPAIVQNLLKLCGTARDGSLLRFSLGNEYLKLGDAAGAATHLREAVARDAGYSAAWKLLGRALAETGDKHGALAAYRSGTAAAEQKGDKQAGKEMAVFARRLAKELGEQD